MISQTWIIGKADRVTFIKSASSFSFSCGKEKYIGLKAPKLAIGRLWGIQIQKEVKSNQKQPSCKKRSAALEKAMVKKDVKSKVAAKKWL